MIDHDGHLAAIADGDPDAFASWVAVAEPRIRASLSSFATSVDTEGVVQECLLRIWQVAPRFEPDGKPEGLLRLGVRIARNLALAELRRRRPELANPQQLQEREGPPIMIPDPDPRLPATIVICLELLPAKPRAAIEARLWGTGQRDKLLAASVRMTINTFLQNVRRARLALAECLKRHGIELENPS